MARHNDVAFLTFGTVPMTPRLFDSMERMLSTMIAGGVPPQVATWALDMLSLYIDADEYEGYLMGQRFKDDSGRTPEEVGMEYFQGVFRSMADLPPERFPSLPSTWSR